MTSREVSQKGLRCLRKLLIQCYVFSKLFRLFYSCQIKRETSKAFLNLTGREGYVLRSIFFFPLFISNRVPNNQHPTNLPRELCRQVPSARGYSRHFLNIGTSVYLASTNFRYFLDGNFNMFQTNPFGSCRCTEMRVIIFTFDCLHRVLFSV